jgi:hypothetical protein
MTSHPDTYGDFVAWRDAHDGEPVTIGDAARYFTGTPFAVLAAWWKKDRQAQQAGDG